MQILSYIKDEKDSEKKEIEGKKKQRTEHHSDDKDKKGEILYLGCCKKGSNIFSNLNLYPILDSCKRKSQNFHNTI